MKKKKKVIVEIEYDPREEPLVEVYFIDDTIAMQDRALEKANQRMRALLTEIRQVLKYLGFNPDVVIKEKTIKKLGDPHYVPVIYVNNVLFGTVYTFNIDKFYEVMKQMKKLREEYLTKIYKDIDRGFIVYTDDKYLHVRNPLYVNKMVHNSQFHAAQRLKLPTFYVDPYEELPVTSWLIKELQRQAVPISTIGVAEEVRYKVYVLPERKPIKL